MALNKYFELEPGAVSALNRRAESVQRAAAEILGVPVPLVVFDENLKIPPETQLNQGFIEETPFGAAMTAQRIEINPRELIKLAGLTARQHPDLPDQALLERVEAQIWKFLVMTTVEDPAQGREDFGDIVRQTFSAAFEDWASREYEVDITKSNKSRDRGGS